ncbi:hypothetical protein Syun_020391 [Stephania yunnanensis]|uniref:Cytochrome P450 n=1 Tax=Stephania yunnanensis TaxID=152371 RepID=A0AAP0IDP9_9MAGN
MLLHLGQVPTLVVSSPDTAREVLKTHDHIFSSRPNSKIGNKFTYGKSLAFAPYGEYWRQIRKIYVLRLLNSITVRSFRAMREEETACLIETIERSSSSSVDNLVDLTEILFMYVNGIVCRATIGRKFSDERELKRLRKMLDDMSHLSNISDDMFVAGTVTTHTVLTWAMAELIRQPNIMNRAQEEVRAISKGKQMVTEDDTEKMPYLQAVIKETLRLRPSGPLMVPHESTGQVKIHGYDIPAKTTVIVNMWAICRDPTAWVEPEKFDPDRFMDSKVDFKGQDFEYIPFGAGRRGCPGVAFAIASLELGLANLLNRFDWAMPFGMDPGELDMGETSGLTVHKKENLVLAAVPRFAPTISLNSYVSREQSIHSSPSLSIPSLIVSVISRITAHHPSASASASASLLFCSRSDRTAEASNGTPEGPSIVGDLLDYLNESWTQFNSIDYDWLDLLACVKWCVVIRVDNCCDAAAVMKLVRKKTAMCHCWISGQDAAVQARALAANSNKRMRM